MSIANWLFSALVMPLLSKATVWVMQYFHDRAEESDRKRRREDLLKKYREAEDAKAQEEAFKNMLRDARRRADGV